MYMRAGNVLRRRRGGADSDVAIHPLQAPSSLLAAAAPAVGCDRNEAAEGSYVRSREEDDENKGEDPSTESSNDECAAAVAGMGNGSSIDLFDIGGEYFLLDGPPMIPAEVLDVRYRKAIAGAALAWATLWIGVAAFTPQSSLLPQETGTASLALAAASLVMSVSVVARGLSLMFVAYFGGTAAMGSTGGGEDVGVFVPPTLIGSHVSGAALVGLFVQACSAINNGTMALFATPMVTDSVRGSGVYLLRWCEWAPLAFLMAFLTASIDAEGEKGFRSALIFGLCQGFSTLCGLFFPLIRNPVLWWIVVILSCSLHSTLYPLLLSKRRQVRALPSSAAFSAAEMERRDRIQAAAQLLHLVTIAWGTLVLLFFLAWILRVSSTTNALMECSVDVLSKHLYLSFLIDAHHRIFNPSKRAERGLAEIGHLMNRMSRRSSPFSSDSDDFGSLGDIDNDDDVSGLDENSSTNKEAFVYDRHAAIWEDIDDSPSSSSQSFSSPTVPERPNSGAVPLGLEQGVQRRSIQQQRRRVEFSTLGASINDDSNGESDGDGNGEVALSHPHANRTEERLRQRSFTGNSQFSSDIRPPAGERTDSLSVNAAAPRPTHDQD